MGITSPLKQKRNAETRDTRMMMSGKQKARNRQETKGSTETRYTIRARETPLLCSRSRSESETKGQKALPTFSKMCSFIEML